MERQYEIKMTITIDEEELQTKSINEVILESLEEAPFQVDCVEF